MFDLASRIGGRFVDNPAFLERIELAVSNFPVLLGLMILVFYLRRWRPDFLPLIIVFVCLIPSVVRYFGGYPYDSPIALLSWVADLSVLTFFQLSVGKFVLRSLNFIESVSVGIGIVISVGVLITYIGIQRAIGSPNILISVVALGSLMYALFRRFRRFLAANSNGATIDAIQPVLVFGVFIFAAPILPYFFTPSPPDVDITAMKEILGFIFQGQGLEHVMPGPVGEYYSIRYPWGVPAIAWVWGHLLHIGASESMTLLWLGTWALLICNIAFLSKLLGGAVWLALLFTLNGTFTGVYGLTGGQIQEMLAYALGIGMITQVLQKKFLTASILIAASMITHPVVALPFCLIWGCEFVVSVFRLIKSRKWVPEQSLVGVILVFSAIAYLGSFSLGAVSYQSQPEKMLASITFAKFFKNVVKWLNADTFNLGFFCVAIVGWWVIQGDNQIKSAMSRIFIWFIGACVINGLFGSTEEFNFTATFQAGFSVGAIWVISMSLVPNFLAAIVKRLNPGITLAAAGVVWLTSVFPSLSWSPSSVFVTHSDIRAAKFLSKYSSRDALIGVICPYSKLWGNKRTLYTMIRGESYRNNLYSIISDHQVKDGKFVSKPDLGMILKPDTTFDKFKGELGAAGITHLMIVSRPETRTWIGEAVRDAIFSDGSTFVFKM